MSGFDSSIFALNPMSNDPNMRGEIPVVMQLALIDPAALSSGVITVDVVSPFGKGLGEALGVVPLSGIESANDLIGMTVAAHSSTDGSLTITINSDDASSTTNIGEIYVLLIGKILPYDQ